MPTGDISGGYGFAGQRYDSIARLEYSSSGYYNPLLHRFISQSPFLLPADSGNPYVRAGNSPANAGSSALWNSTLSMHNAPARDFLLQANDFFNGFADRVTGGLSTRAQQWIGNDDLIDTTSDAYRNGGYAGQVVNIGLMIASGGATGLAKLGAGAINATGAVGNTWNAADAMGHGDYLGAASGIAQAGLMGLNGFGSACRVSKSFAGLGSAAETAAAVGTRGMLGFGAVMGGINGGMKIANGEYVGGALDFLEAGVAGAHMLRSCFAAGTKLLTEEGYRRVEETLEDDHVGSRDEHDPQGPLVYKRVEEVFTRAAMILELQIGGQTIKTTGEHPFYVEHRGWVPAKELSTGDQLATLDGQYVAVESFRATQKFVQVYNFRIADHHTY